jgi:hypothetical protein
MRLWLEAEKDLFNTTLNLYCKRMLGNTESGKNSSKSA